MKAVIIFLIAGLIIIWSISFFGSDRPGLDGIEKIFLHNLIDKQNKQRSKQDWNGFESTQQEIDEKTTLRSERVQAYYQIPPGTVASMPMHFNAICMSVLLTGLVILGYYICHSRRFKIWKEKFLEQTKTDSEF